MLAACGAQQKRDEVAGCRTRPDDAVGPIQVILPGSGKILAVRRGVVPRGDHLVAEFIRPTA